MKYCTKAEAVARMNQWGKEGQPFLFVIDYKQEKCLVERPEDIDPSEMLYDLEGWRNTDGISFPNRTTSVVWEIDPVSEADYTRSFQMVQQAIYAGNSYLVNLTCPTKVRTNLSLEEVFHGSRAKYKLWLKDHFVVFSPEIFVRIEQGRICSFPMKGTIDSDTPNACQVILDDPKETAEHATIVDLIRNDLSMVANQVDVPRYRYIDELQTNCGGLLQVSSEVAGHLPEDWPSRLGDIFFLLLPAGSITGAPKRKTVEIIEEAEGYARGFYTGVMGCFDGKNVNSAVMIRFIEQQDGLLIFKSGGGITSRSDCHSEYNEMKQKVYVPIY